MTYLPSLFPRCRDLIVHPVLCFVQLKSRKFDESNEMERLRNATLHTLNKVRVFRAEENEPDAGAFLLELHSR